MSTCSASCEVVWLRKLLFDLFDLQLDSTCIYCDNQSYVKLSENPVFHDKSNHIEKINLEGYSDSYWAGSAIDRKRTLGCCFCMGSGVISSFSRKQSCVALSTTEAEYLAACSASCEVVWIRKLLSDLFDL